MNEEKKVPFKWEYGEETICCPVNISMEHIEFSRHRKTESVTL